MAEFIHCNKCLKIGLNDSSVQYYLTECSKVFCNHCIDTSVTNCPKCEPNVCRLVALNGSTAPDIQLLFKDMSSSLQRLERVDIFQTSQRNYLIKSLSETNKRLIDEITHKNQLIQNMDNELKILRTRLDHRSGQQINADNPFDPMFNSSAKTQTMDDKSIVKDLFKSEAKNQSIFGNNPLISNTNDNQFRNSLNQFNANSYKPMASAFAPKISVPSMSTTSQRSLSPLQSIRKSKISLKAKNTTIGYRQSGQTLNSSPIIGHNFVLPPMKPMTITKNKVYVTPTSMMSNKTNSSGHMSNRSNSSGRMSVNRPISPLTAYSSVMSMSTLNRRLNH